jgi:4-amino-4-deoxy-L-arabinose transferase-like glycosyltransferase
VEGRTVWRAGASGLCAGVAAASSLLTAAAVPVLACWLLVYDRGGSRCKKLAAFAAGAAIACAPIVWLFALGPRQTWFNVVQYHAHFRTIYWPETTQHDLEVLTSWIQSAPATLVGGLAIFGLWRAARANWPRERKSELYLCGWLATALGVLAGSAHPTFPRYFALTLPFLGVLAAVGLDAIRPGRRSVAVVAIVLLVGLGRSLYDRRAVDPWSVYETLAQKMNEVTPVGAPLLADEPIYFLTRRMPPSGFELYYTHKIDLPSADRQLLHVVTEEEVRQMARAGFFATVYSCDSEEAEDYGLPETYREKVEMSGCAIYWGRKATSP